MLTKKEADKLIKMKGEARGIVFKVDWDYINETKGKQGIKKLEAKMAELGFPFKYEEIRSMDFYPLGLYIISLLSTKEVFNFDKKDILEMGASIVKFSLFMKIFFKYFISLDLIAKQVPKMWRKHYTVGEMEMPDFSEEKRYAILRIRNFKDHPVHCILTTGYFVKVAQLVVKAPATCEETKCIFRGDEYHELLMKW